MTVSQELIQKMVEVVQGFDQPDVEDLFFSAKLIKSIESGFSRFCAFDDDTYDPGWASLTLEDISEDGPIGFHYVCIEFNDRGRLPLPILYRGESDYPLQDEIIKLYRETDEAKQILKDVDHAISSGERILKERLMKEFPEGDHIVYVDGLFEIDPAGYFNRSRCNVVYKVDVTVKEVAVRINSLKKKWFNSQEFSDADVHQLNCFDVVNAKISSKLEEIEELVEKEEYYYY